MEPLILKPSPTALWQTLVAEAEDTVSIHLNEELESYLVFLLMRFVKDPEILKSVLATDFLTSLKKLRHEPEELRAVGDKCLLFSGFFPGRAKHCRVRVSYFVKLGQSAYGSLSLLPASSQAALFAKLRLHFVCLMDILHTIRDNKHDDNFLDLLQAEELWQDTHSNMH
jgi:hypothetical protein